MRLAIITGVTGQDGSYLSEILLELGYTVYGIIRRASNFNTQRIEHLLSNKNLHLKYGDLTDSNLFHNLLRELEDITDVEIIEIYNLGAMSHVKVSFEIPEYVAQVDAVSTVNILEAIRNSKLKKLIRFYQASTSELYGKVQAIPQDENTPFYPRSPYAVAKLYSYWIVKNYREAYDIFACNGILFNHESSRRGATFVTRKITIGLGKILKGELEYLSLGNLDAKRDWGHAKDYCYGMYLMLQQDKPDDYVLSSNSTHSVREFVEKAFELRNINIKWEGSGVNEVGMDSVTGRVLVRVDSRYFRPTEVDLLLGDSSKARRELGWKPETSFEDLIKEMVENDCKK